jgi:hypothetical protein
MSKYVVYRKRNNLETPVVNGECLEFIQHYLKHNALTEELESYYIYEMIQIPTQDVFDGKFEKKVEVAPLEPVPQSHSSKEKPL